MFLARVDNRLIRTGTANLADPDPPTPTPLRTATRAYDAALDQFAPTKPASPSEDRTYSAYVLVLHRVLPGASATPPRSARRERTGSGDESWGKQVLLVCLVR